MLVRSEAIARALAQITAITIGRARAHPLAEAASAAANAEVRRPACGRGRLKTMAHGVAVTVRRDAELSRLIWVPAASDGRLPADPLDSIAPGASRVRIRRGPAHRGHPTALN